MKAIEYRTVDKSSWQRGPWDDEPDKAQWQDTSTGLPCLIVRNNGGALCGYVGVDPSHPWHGKSYNSALGECVEDCSEDYHYSHSILCGIRVHGGLTFSDSCRPSADESIGICHLPEPGDADNVWWFGFDCSHCDDESPGVERRYLFGRGEYRDIEYVRSQCASLAAQLRAAERAKA